MGKYEQSDKKNREVHKEHIQTYFIFGLVGQFHNLRFRGTRYKCAGEPKISEVVIHMGTFPNPTKTHGEKNCFRNMYF